MSVVLSVYSKKAFKEFLLPAIDDSDYSITIEGRLFGFGKDARIYLLVHEGSWRISSNPTYAIKYVRDEAIYDGNRLEDDDVLLVTLSSGEQVSVLVNVVDRAFNIFDKYCIDDGTSISIGRDQNMDIVYSRLGLVSREHAVISKDSLGYVVEDKSSNGTFLNGKKIEGKSTIEFGDCVDIFGLRLVFTEDFFALNKYLKGVEIRSDNINEFSDPPASLANSNYASSINGKQYFHRSPRNIEPINCDTVEIEAPPEPKELNAQPTFMAIGPSLTMALPMLMGCMLSIYSSHANGGNSSLFMYTGLVTAVGSSIIGAVWSIMNMRQARIKNRTEENKRFKSYSEYLIEMSNQIKAKYDSNTNALIKMYPASNDCIKYDIDSVYLWNRNFHHEDFLSWRIGIGNIPFQVDITIPKERFNLINDSLADKPKLIKESYKYLQNVPVTLDLNKNKLIGIIGGDGKDGCYQIMHVLATQIAANNCYTDVKMAFIYDETKDAASQLWKFAKWLPHVWAEDKKTRYVAGNKTDASEVFYEITKTLRMRAEERENRLSSGKSIQKPYYILFLENAAMLEGELISKYIYDIADNMGITTIVMVDNYEDLPNACETIIENTSAFKGIYNVADRLEDRLSVSFDNVTEDELEKFARSLSKIEVKEEETSGEIPETLTFFEMYGVNHPHELNAIERWRKNRTYDSMRALIGQKSGGNNCYLDVHEKYHGPHGLVAGTTGSGKSETLQTYMLSLALNFSPDDIGFFVIDYKGGGMANLFEKLPHMIGSISNLSGNQVRRAMVSIKSENKRRQRIFNENGVNNINLYTRLYKNKEAITPVPHLFIIIDEFAELKREEPDFMRELVSVVQVGRSLGVHLILATQKPGGTVDDNIWSNSKFKLCLRVQDRQDSNDMLHKPDAAYITQAGRCYLQVGNDELYELFQSGWSGANYDESADTTAANIAQMLTLNGKTALVGSHTKNRKQTSKIKEKTQLDAVIDYLADVAHENNFENDIKLWMPLLPTELYLNELDGYTESSFDGTKWVKLSKDYSLSTLVGKYDDPENQTQKPFALDIAVDGNHAIIGTVVTGKSTFLMTYLYSLINRYSPDAVSIYILDYSSKMLGALESAPHVGGVTFEDDTEKVAKFFAMLQKILAERKKLFRGGSYSQYIQANGLEYPTIVVAIDNIGAFRARTENRYDDVMMTILKEGPGYGILFIVTASGFGMTEIPNRMSDNFRRVLCLEMNDTFAYSDVLRTIHVDVHPEENIKGRGIAKIGDSILEFQTALVARAEDDFKRNELVVAQMRNIAEVWTGKKARRIPEIPKKAVWSEFSKLDEVSLMISENRLLPLGYDRRDASIYGIDLAYNYCYLISGRARTGKTNMLRVAMESVAMLGGQIVVIDYNGELKLVADSTNATYISNGQELFDYMSQTLLPTFKERNTSKKKYDAQGLSIEEKYKQMQNFEKIFIFVGNLCEFIQGINRPSDAEGDVSAFVRNILDKGACHNVFWFAGFTPEEKNLVGGDNVFKLFTRDGQGIHFGGKVDDVNYLQFDHINYTQKSNSEKIGTGWLTTHDTDSTNAVVVPLYMSE